MNRFDVNAAICKDRLVTMTGLATRELQGRITGSGVSLDSVAGITSTGTAGCLRDDEGFAGLRHAISAKGEHVA